MKIYFDFRDWWIGYYRGDNHHFVCLLPTVVIRWNRKQKFKSLIPPPSPINARLNTVIRDVYYEQLRAQLMKESTLFTEMVKPDVVFHVKKWTDLNKTVEDIKRWPSNPA